MLGLASVCHTVPSSGKGLIRTVLLKPVVLRPTGTAIFVPKQAVLTRLSGSGGGRGQPRENRPRRVRSRRLQALVEGRGGRH
jgi:hypothetical protein